MADEECALHAPGVHELRDELRAIGERVVLWVVGLSIARLIVGEDAIARLGQRRDYAVERIGRGAKRGAVQQHDGWLRRPPRSSGYAGRQPRLSAVVVPCVLTIASRPDGVTRDRARRLGLLSKARPREYVAPLLNPSPAGEEAKRRGRGNERKWAKMARVLAKNVRFFTRKVRHSPSGGMKRCDILRHFATFTRKSGRRPSAPAAGGFGAFKGHGRGTGAAGGMGECRGRGVSRRSGRSLREGAWIPVSAHENDEGCVPDGGAGSVSGRIRSPLLNPPPVGEEVKREEAGGARTPSSILPRRAGGGGKAGGGGVRQEEEARELFRDCFARSAHGGEGEDE